MPQVINDIIFWLSPTAAGLVVWSCYKIFEMLNEKIEISKEISQVSVNTAKLKADVQVLKANMSMLSENVDSSMSRVDKKLNDLHSQFMITDKKIHAAINTSQAHEKTLENYGKVIHLIVKKMKQ